jgi:hypothetical protein
LTEPEEHISLSNNDEKLLIEKIPDPNPDDAPMIIRHDEDLPKKQEDDFTI